LAQARRVSQSAAAQGRLQLGEKLAAEDTPQDAYRHQVLVAAAHPSRTIFAEPATDDDAVQVRVEEELLGPGVQDGRETDPDAQPAAGHLQERLGHGRKSSPKLSLGSRQKNGCSSEGTVKTRWKYGAGKSLRSCASAQSA